MNRTPPATANSPRLPWSARSPSLSAPRRCPPPRNRRRVADHDGCRTDDRGADDRGADDDPRHPKVPLQPLTGLPIDGDRHVHTAPAMVVKIDNVEAEPQSGLNEADIVFEEIVEAGSPGSRPCSIRGTPIRSGRSAPGARQDINITAH